MKPRLSDFLYELVLLAVLGLMFGNFLFQIGHDEPKRQEPVFTPDPFEQVGPQQPKELKPLSA